MKLPGYQAGAVQSLQGVDPGVYRELGRAQAQFGQAIGQGGEALKNRYLQVATADENAGRARLASEHSKMRQEFERKPYLSPDELPADMVNPKILELFDEERVNPETGETETVQVAAVPTYLVADELYRRGMERTVSELESGARTRLGRDRIREWYTNEGQWKGEAEIAGIAYQQRMIAEQAEVAEQGEAYIKAEAPEELRAHYDRAMLSGIIDKKQRNKAVADGVETIQINSYVKSIESPYTPDSVLKKMPEAIDNDSSLSPDKAAQLSRAATARWEDKNANYVSDAIVERDIGRLQDLRDLYASPEEGDRHSTGLDGVARNRLVSQIDRALKGIADGNAAFGKAQKGLAQEQIAQVVSSLESGGFVLPHQVAAVIDQNVDAAYPLESDMSASDAKERYRLSQIRGDLADMETIAYGTKDEADQVIAEYRATATDPSKSLEQQTEARLRADRLEKYANTIETAKSESLLSLAVAGGIVEPVQFDDTDITGSLQAEFQAQKAAGEHYGRIPPVISPQTAQAFSVAWSSADDAGKMDIASQVGQAYQGDPDKLEDFAAQLSDAEGYGAFTFEVAARGDAQTFSMAQDGRRLRGTENGKALLKEAGLDRYALVKIDEELRPFYPHTVGERSQVIMDVAASLIVNENMSASKATKEAIERIVGRRVKGVGTNEKVRPPVPGMSQTQFRAAQESIGNDAYKRFGYEGVEDMRDLVRSGDVIFRNAEGGAGVYYLYDTRAGAPVGNKKGDKLVKVYWNDRGINMTAMDRAEAKANAPANVYKALLGD